MVTLSCPEGHCCPHLCGTWPAHPFLNTNVHWAFKIHESLKSPFLVSFPLEFVERAGSPPVLGHPILSWVPLRLVSGPHNPVSGPPSCLGSPSVPCVDVSLVWFGAFLCSPRVVKGGWIGGVSAAGCAGWVFVLARLHVLLGDTGVLPMLPGCLAPICCLDSLQLGR